MKKVLCGFVFGLMLMVSGAQAWADGPIQLPAPNPRLVQSWSDGPIQCPPPPNPKFEDVEQ
jgi:hypothetical protein